MKQWVTFIFILLIIICSGIMEIRYLKKTALYELYEVEYTKNLLNNNKMDEAHESAKNLENSWDNLRNTWRLFINHSEIDEIDRNVLELVSYISQDEKEEAIVRVDTLGRDFKHVVENEKITIQNIF